MSLAFWKAFLATNELSTEQMRCVPCKCLGGINGGSSRSGRRGPQINRRTDHEFKLAQECLRALLQLDFFQVPDAVQNAVGQTLFGSQRAKHPVLDSLFGD